MSWELLDREIAAWAASGQAAALWWRDDDAIAATAALERLLALAAAAEIPVALAVIPASTEASLVHRIAEAPLVTVLQHGYAHANHAQQGERALECGGARPLTTVAAELRSGRERLESLFGNRFCPVLVPPWNRIDAALPAMLPGLGLRGLSIWGPRRNREAAPRIVEVNTHADLIAWRRGRIFAGRDRVLDALAGHLADKRAGRADRGEATGLLTHHLAHDEPGWAFLQELVAWSRGRPGLRWLSAAEAFGFDI